MNLAKVLKSFGDGNGDGFGDGYGSGYIHEQKNFNSWPKNIVEVL